MRSEKYLQQCPHFKVGKSKLPMVSKKVCPFIISHLLFRIIETTCDDFKINFPKLFDNCNKFTVFIPFCSHARQQCMYDFNFHNSTKKSILHCIKKKSILHRFYHQPPSQMEKLRPCIDIMNLNNLLVLAESSHLL